MDITKPYYVVDFSASACRFEMRVNDVPLFNMNVEGQVGTEFPMNTLILESGKQVLSVNILPCLGETKFHKRSSFSTKILLFDVSNGFKLISHEFEQVMPVVNDNTLPFYTDITTFEAKVPFKLDAWQKSKDLNQVESLKSMILEEYRKIIYLLENKNYDAFKTIFAQREHNAAVSLYLNKERSENRLNSFINDLQQGYKPIPFTGEETVNLYADGKLAELKSIDGDAALWFEHEEQDELISLEMFFHMPDDKLKVI